MIVVAVPKSRLKRKMRVYFSERQAVAHTEHSSTLYQTAEKAKANVRVDKELYDSIGPLWRRIFTHELWNSQLGEVSPSPRLLDIPGNALGEFEYAVADTKKALWDGSVYSVPVRIFASV